MNYQNQGLSYLTKWNGKAGNIDIRFDKLYPVEKPYLWIVLLSIFFNNLQ